MFIDYSQSPTLTLCQIPIDAHSLQMSASDECLPIKAFIIDELIQRQIESPIPQDPLAYLKTLVAFWGKDGCLILIEHKTHLYKCKSKLNHHSIL